jgi:hypothetical protein
MSAESPRTLRRAYRAWVEEQVEEFKDRIPRAHLLSIADEVVTELRMTRGGQYQLTELLLCNAMDRYLVRMLKLPGYRAWCAQRRAAQPLERDPTLIPFPTGVAPVAAPPAPAEADEAEREAPLACVV